MKILMVCLGNICRSPLAEGILQHKAWQHNLQWTVESAGTAAYHTGEPPHKLSQKVAKINGVDISKQKAQKFKKEDIHNFDLIFVMDKENYKDVKRICGNYFVATKVNLLMNELYPNNDLEVPDLWYGTEPGYHEVYEMIEKACNKIIEKYSK